MATALDRLIDQACGLQPGAFVTMRCPKCQKQRQALRHDSDPEGTAVVEAECPGCARAGGKEYAVQYFGPNGQELRIE